MTNVDEKSHMDALDREQVMQAVQAIYKYVKKKQGKDVLLLDDSEKISLHLTLKRISSSQKIIKIALPTPLTTDTSDVCLFVKDQNKTERDYSATVRHYQELLQGKGVKEVKEIIPLKAIKTEYVPFEAKRNLSNAFDVYLADARIMRLLPGLLGKNFYGRKRFPVQVNLTAGDLKTEVTKALGCAQCILSGRGSSCQVTVAHTGLSEEESVNNIVAAVEKLKQSIPGGETNIRILHLRTLDSPALAIFASLDPSSEVVLPKGPPAPPLDDPEEVTTVLHGKVQVTPQGHIRIINKATAGRYTRSPEPPKQKKSSAQKRKLRGKKKQAAKLKQAKKSGKMVDVKKEPVMGKSEAKKRKAEVKIKPGDVKTEATDTVTVKSKKRKVSSKNK